MTVTMTILLAAGAFLLGLTLSALYSAHKRQKLISETAVLKGQIDGADKLLAATKEGYEQRLKSLQADADRDLQQAKSTWEEQHLKELENQSNHFNEMTKALETRMKAATEEMLKQRQKDFADSSTKDLDNLLTPLTRTIAEMKEAMQKSKETNDTMSAKIDTNLHQIIERTLAAERSADELTSALKHKTKVQGDMGEVVLSNILTRYGLTEGKEYSVQDVLRDEQGKTIKPEGGSSARPDVILHLDDKRDVIIDSKMSLTYFIDYVNAEDDDTRREKLKAHIGSVRSHVKELAGKKYQDLYGDRTIDFVIMFVPLTSALLVATQEEPTLWSEAMQQRVFIADEQTLFAAIKIINLTWVKIEQEKNQQALYTNAKLLLDRMADFLAAYDEIGKSLAAASKTYADSRAKLLDKGHSIPTAAKNILKAGAHPSSDEKRTVLNSHIAALDSAAEPDTLTEGPTEE